MCNERPWWKRPLRVIQTNLQVLDTPRMDEARIAAQIEDLGANVLVVNVGGIYAWYPTALPFHTVNPCLPKDHDLLEALLAACHARGIRVVARFDFSKASDRTYQMRPHVLFFYTVPFFAPLKIFPFLRSIFCSRQLESEYPRKFPGYSAFSDDSFPQRYLSPFSLNYSAKIPSMVLCALAAASAGVLVPVMDSFTARERASEISGHWA